MKLLSCSSKGPSDIEYLGSDRDIEVVDSHFSEILVIFIIVWEGISQVGSGLIVDSKKLTEISRSHLAGDYLVSQT